MRAIHHFSMNAAVAICMVATSATASADDSANRTGAPYILVTSSVAQTDSLPLKESRAEVHIAGVMAHVTVTQVYENHGQVPLEAVYVFPGSTRAAVFGMEMTVGDRVTQARIAKREAARKLYEAARADGMTASLLEQHRPNVFQMNVANILPGDTVKVELNYTELIVPTDGIYEFVYPAVVGPRYAGEQTSGETWHENHYSASGAGAPYQYGVQLNIATGVPLHGLASPSHTIKPVFAGKNRAQVALTSHRDGDRDFVLRYRLRGGTVETGLLRFEDQDERFFLLMVQPPARVVRDDMPAREYVFIVDVSGSMSGFPLNVSKKVIANLLRGLRPQDSFNILFFSGGSYQLSPHSVRASEKNLKRALRVLDERRGGGGTNLVAALEKALKMPSGPGTARTFVAVTDGFVSADERAFQTVRNNLGEANFFAFGIGSSVNRNLIEGLARAGMGEPFVVLNGQQAPHKARAFRTLISSPVLTDIKAEFHDFEAYDVVPKAIPDLFADRPLIVFGKYRGDGAGAIEVSGVSGRGGFRKRIAVASAAPMAHNAALRYLWARQRIAELSDLIPVSRRRQELQTEVTNLGLTYNLLTAYTSFIAVDPRVRNPNGRSVEVKQKLPTPAGMVNPTGPSATSSGPIPGRSFGHALNGSISVESEHIVVTGSAIRGKLIDVNARYRRTGGVQPLDERSSTVFTGIANGLTLSQRFRVGTREETSQFTTPMLLRLGIANLFEARVGSTLYTRVDGERRKPDLTLGLKVRLPSPHYRLGFGVMGELRSSFDDLDTEQALARAMFLASASLWDRLVLRLNLGGAYRALLGVDEARLGLAYGADLAMPLYLSGSRTSIEPHLGIAGLSGEDAISSLELGTVTYIGDSWAIGALLQFGLTDDSDNVAGGLILRYAPRFR